MSSTNASHTTRVRGRYHWIPPSVNSSSSSMGSASLWSLCLFLQLDSFSSLLDSHLPLQILPVLGHFALFASCRNKILVNLFFTRVSHSKHAIEKHESLLFNIYLLSLSFAHQSFCKIYLSFPTC